MPKVQTNGREEVAKALKAIETNAKEGKGKELQITPPNMRIIRLQLVGTTPLVQHRFGAKARAQMIATQEAGSQAKKGKKREC